MAVKDHRSLCVICSEINFKVVEIVLQRGMKRLTLREKCRTSVMMFESKIISVYLPEN